MSERVAPPILGQALLDAIRDAVETVIRQANGNGDQRDVLRA